MSVLLATKTAREPVSDQNDRSSVIDRLIYEEHARFYALPFEARDRLINRPRSEEEARERIKALIFRNVKTALAERSKRLDQMNAASGNTSLKDALQFAKDLGCTCSEGEREGYLRHELATSPYTYYKNQRYAGHAMLRWLTKIERWQNRVYAEMPTIRAAEPQAETAPVEAAGPIEIDPASFLPTAIPTLVVWVIYKPETTLLYDVYFVRSLEFTPTGTHFRAEWTHHPTLEAARTKGLPPGLRRSEHSLSGVSTIVESWC